MTGIIPGQPNGANDVMNAFGSNFNDTVQNLFNADYLGFDSRLANSGIPNLKNVFYSTFTSDDAEVVENFEYNATNDLYNTVDWDTIQGSANYYAIDIYADDVTITSITGTTVQRMSEGIWRVYSTDTSVDVARAKVVENLFKPSSNSDATTSQIISNTTNITSLRTSESGDVGYRFTYSYGSWNQDVTDSNAISSITGTFSDTTNNLNSRAWGLNDGSTGSIGGLKKWGKFDGNGADPSEASTFTFVDTFESNDNSFGTSVSQGVSNNPTNIEVAVHHQNNAADFNFGSSALVMYKSGTVSYIKVDGVNKTADFFETFDFDNNGIPAMIDQTDSTLETISTLIFKDTTSETATNAIIAINSQIDATSSEQISVSFDGSTFTDVNNTEISRATPTGTALWRKIVITRTDLSKEDKVTEQAVKFNFY